VAQRLAGEGFDLLLLYFRSPDIVSHNEWRYFEPERFGAVDPRELAARRDRVPAVYRAVDEALGRLLAAAPADANVLVVSDHGFHAARAEEETRVVLDLDAVLERLGFLVRRPDGAVDLTRSRLYTYASPDFRRARYLRFALAGREPGGRVRPAEREVVRGALERALAGVTYAGGEPVFFLRPARRREAEQGADFVVGVSPRGATEVLLAGGRPLAGAVTEISRISGTHTRSTHGIFLAAGPDIDPVAQLEGIRIHDLAPTVLYGLGLPVARDFAGRPRVELFRAAFRERHPLQEIPTWGKRRASGPTASAADEKLVEELRALGYLN
jgi:predicted AlkP superfamily phosphohydrolase/phosphomutase